MKDKKTFPVSEIFKSIQGEGDYAGRVAVFVRFSGCDYGCAWCDTNTEEYTHMSSEDIIQRVAEVSGSMFPVVVLTGGNPCLFDLEELVKELKKKSHPVHVETQGSVLPEWLAYVDHVTISPKGPSAGFITPMDNIQRALFKFSNITLKPVVMVDSLGGVNEEDVEYARTLIKESDKRVPAVNVNIQLGAAEGYNNDLNIPIIPYSERYAALCELLMNDKDFCAPNISIMPQIHKIGGLR